MKHRSVKRAVLFVESAVECSLVPNIPLHVTLAVAAPGFPPQVTHIFYHVQSTDCSLKILDLVFNNDFLIVQIAADFLPFVFFLRAFDNDVLRPHPSTASFRRQQA